MLTNVFANVNEHRCLGSFFIKQSRKNESFEWFSISGIPYDRLFKIQFPNSHSVSFDSGKHSILRQRLLVSQQGSMDHSVYVGN